MSLRLYGDDDPRVVEARAVLREHALSCDCEKHVHSEPCEFKPRAYRAEDGKCVTPRTETGVVHICDFVRRVYDKMPSFGVCSVCRCPVEYERDESKPSREQCAVVRHVAMFFDKDEQEYVPDVAGVCCPGSGKEPLKL